MTLILFGAVNESKRCLHANLANNFSSLREKSSAHVPHLLFEHTYRFLSEVEEVKLLQKQVDWYGGWSHKTSIALVVTVEGVVLEDILTNTGVVLEDNHMKSSKNQHYLLRIFQVQQYNFYENRSRRPLPSKPLWITLYNSIYFTHNQK